jgi:hypothetical protein
MGDAGKILCALIVEIDLGDGLPVKIDQFVRGKYNGRAQLQEAMVGESFDDQLCPNAIQVSGGDTYDGSLLLAHSLNFQGQGKKLAASCKLSATSKTACSYVPGLKLEACRL